MKKQLQLFVWVWVAISLGLAGCSREGVHGLPGKHLPSVSNKVTQVFYTSAAELAATYDKNNTASQTLHDEIYNLYQQGKWGELETIFSQNNLNGGWPPSNGGFNIKDNIPLKKGMCFDRYSGAVGNYTGTGVPILGGNFTCPVIRNKTYSFGQRALNKAENQYDFYFRIEIMKDLPFMGQEASIIPWFKQPGLGKQVMWKIPIDTSTGYPTTWNKLAEEGFIKITIISSPSGKYSQLAGTVISS